MKVKYELDGMTCNHCVMTVQKTFQKQGLSAVASLANKSVEFESNGTEEEISQMRKLLDEEGFALKEKIG